MAKKTIENGWLIFEDQFFTKLESDQYYSYFLNSLEWQSGEIKIFGKTLEIPRKQVMFSEEGLEYGYSGKRLESSPWNPKVEEIKSRIENKFKYEFNACLANLYRDGNDSNGWHSDDEPELGLNPVIASVSFGATRKFQLRHKITKERIDIDLTHGSLLITGGEMQHFWKHQIPKTKKIVEPRVNLTFRKLL